MLRVISIVRSCNLSLSEIKNEYADDFQKIFQREKEWLGDIQQRIEKISNKEDQFILDNVVKKLKEEAYVFLPSDTELLSKFTGKISGFYRIANRINNFKEGTYLDNGEKLHLFSLFNEIKKAGSFSSINIILNSNLKTFLPHLFSVVKHIQNPLEFPIYYKYWKNILREVFLRKDDYDNFCLFYRELPPENRHLNFGCYFGVIGTNIARRINAEKIIKSDKDPEYKYIKENVLNIPDYLSLIQVDPEKESIDNEVKYWLYSPGKNAEFWNEFFEKGFMAIGNDELGDLENYSSKEEIVAKLQEIEETESSKKNDATAMYEFKNLMNIGDVIIAKKGQKELVGYGVVTSDYYYDETRSTYQKCRNVDWKKKGSWDAGHKLVIKALTNITNYETEHSDYEKYYERLLSIINGNLKGNENMTKTPFNLILYGPPGTGKTYNTTAFAARLIEGGDPFKIMTNLEKNELSDIEVKRFAELRKSGQIEFITFHQSYSYEDFVEGIKPDVSVENEQMKFRLNEGIFKKICATAEINSKLSSSDNQKYLFEDVWHNFIKNVDFSLDEEKEVPMKTTSFFIYDYNETTIRFRKKIGKSIHTLAFATLKKMFYEGKNDIISGGLEPYYSALLSQLMKVSGTINNDSHEPKNFVLIIDEINRGNISRIFGELITLIEEDKRDGKLTVKLPYSQEDFTVPSNLFIIGTMNTADRSIALLDIALRRRFTFFRFDPRPELVEFKKAREIMENLNEKIKKYKSSDFQIGHSYFMKVTNDEELETVLKYKINPLLEEYFVNDPKRLEELKSLMDKKS